MQADDDEIARLKKAISEADLNYDAGDYKRAEPIYRRAVLFTLPDLEFRHCLERLVLIYVGVQKNYSESLRISLRLLALNESEFGRTDQRTVQVMRDLSAIYDKLGKHGEAERMRNASSEREAGRLQSTNPDSSPSSESDEPEAAASNQPRLRSRVNVQEEAFSVQAFFNRLRPFISTISIIFRPRKGRNAMIAVVLICLFFVGQTLFSLIPRAVLPATIYHMMSHFYQTSDRRIKFSVLDEKVCRFEADDENFNKLRMDTPLCWYLYDFRDLLDITFGSLRYRDYWILRNSDSVVDEQGHVYYAVGSSENQILDRMIALSECAKESYLRSKHFPETLAEMEKVCTPSINPISNKTEVPDLQVITTGDKDRSQERSTIEREKFYRVLGSGSKWEREPQATPGSLHCCLVKFVSTKGEVDEFVIRGHDRNADPFPSTTPNQAYSIILRDGKEVFSHPPGLPFSGQTVLRNRRTWLIDASVGKINLFLFRYIPIIVFAFFAICSFIVWGFERNFGNSRGASRLAIIGSVCLLLALAYQLSLFAPW